MTDNTLRQRFWHALTGPALTSPQSDRDTVKQLCTRLNALNAELGTTRNQLNAAREMAAELIRERDEARRVAVFLTRPWDHDAGLGISCRDLITDWETRQTPTTGENT